MCRNQQQPQSGEKVRSTGSEESTSTKAPSSPTSVDGRNPLRRTNSGRTSRLRIVVLGGTATGKSALTVRYLTRRYISEYRSNTDLLYRHTVSLDDVMSDVEILDVSCRENLEGISAAQARWGEGFVVVYSVEDAASFHDAQIILDALQRYRAPLYVPVILLANKRDLEHCRKVSVEEGQALSLQHSCQFYEVSAAESHIGVTLAFQSLLRETRSLQTTRSLPRQRRLSIIGVSKMIGSLVGRGRSDDPPSPTSKPTLIIPAGNNSLRKKGKKHKSI
ncbi:unnamed protein product [Meganyctiphanes norvegica]|uniref:small monomeric GTPase n=1 Tax=Meganyctiphanes norvegica TaxID=48144 RepID=A0AAV2QG64_MEGNR